jgi:decaprenylphospho-beta-D-ribofuranose 2-oxidase
MDSSQHQLLTGWGRTSPSLARVVPTSRMEVGTLASLISSPGPQGIIPRGLGRSYGDAAQCAGGTVLDATGLDHLGSFDPGTGLLTIGAGVSLGTLMRTFLPRGWFVPVTPGTRQVTVGGAIAADIHGKNHHVDGSLSAHVRSLTLATPTGTRVLRPGSGPEDPGEDAKLFWATAGGMGLTGLILEATLQMLAVETASICVDTERLPDLGSLLAAMSSRDEHYRYSVAWVDSLARGRRLGRAVLTRGNHARLGDLPPARRQPEEALAFTPSSGLEAPPQAPGGLLNQVTVRAFNEAWFRKAPRSREGQIQALAAFFHPLDGVGGWNRLYGPRGFLQYQFVVPFGAEEVLRLALERCSQAGAASFLTVLKRFGPGAGPLSFPMPGWTLALDLPAGRPLLASVLDGLDEAVASAGGRVYLAKDSRLSPELLGTMYPRLAEWRSARDQADPEGVLQSDLGRRLGLVRRPPAPPPAPHLPQGRRQR